MNKVRDLVTYLAQHRRMISIKQRTAIREPGYGSGFVLYAFQHLVSSFLTSTVFQYPLILEPRGIINSFGAYQEYYSSALLNNSSASLISWIGTIQGFLVEAMGLFIGPVFDSCYFHSLIYAGSVLVVLGTMALSICNNYWQVFLAQGLCIGLGTGMVFVPSVSVVTTGFNRKRAIAIGIVSSASSLGMQLSWYE